MERQNRQNKFHKKSFNKKEFFNQKYKKNYGSQQEGHGRALLQKKAFVRRYYKEKQREERRERKKMQQQDENMKIGTDESDEKRPQILSRDTSKLTKDNEDEGTFPYQSGKKKVSSWKRARLQYRQKIAEKEQKQQERDQRKKEIENAIVKRKEERLKRYKKLNQKTRKGQPIMRGRIELMLEKLEQEMS